MSTVNRQLDRSDEIEAAETAVDVAAEAVDAARDRLSKAAETLRQAENNLVKVHEKHGIPVPEWPENAIVARRRWWAAEMPVQRPSWVYADVGETLGPAETRHPRPPTDSFA